MKTTSHYRGPKRVRIQTGHEARFIEKRNPYRSCAKKFKGTHKILQKDRAGKIAWDKTHRPSISELVYRYLEKESNREVIDMQKNNATKQFRKFHRRKYLKKLASNVRKSPHKTMKNESFNSIPWKPEMLSQSKKWPKKGHDKITSCILEVLYFGTVLGLLEPKDEKGGVIFRINSNINLSNKK